MEDGEYPPIFPLARILEGVQGSVIPWLGKDLLFIHKLSLYDALGCKKNRIIYIKMLDLKTIGIYISDKTIIKSRHIKKIKNQGMPIVKQTENFPSSVSFGNMYILFDIFY